MVLLLKKWPLGAATLFLGFLFTVGFAPLYWWPVSLVALAGLYLLSVEAKNGRQAFTAGWLFGVGHHLVGLSWLPVSVYTDQQSVLVSVLVGGGGLLGISFILAIYIGLTCFATYRTRAWPWLTPFAFAFVWAGLEIIRGWLFTGFPWNPAGAIWANSLYLVQSAAFVKVWGLSALVALCGALLVAWRVKILPALGVLLVLAVFGWQRVEAYGPTAYGETRIRLVQAGYQQAHHWQPERRWQLLEQHTSLNNPYPAEEAAVPDIILWSENAISFFLEEESFIRQHISASLRPQQTLVAGVVRKVPGGYGNSIVALDDSVRALDVYDKHHLVPYGEYLPFRDWMPEFLQDFTHSRSDFLPGTGPMMLNIGHGIRALPLVCYEGIFPYLSSQPPEGVQVLVNLTNDVWFTNTLGPYQHYAMARLRAVETGLPLLRAANTGITAVVDGLGRELKRLPLKQPGVIDIKLPLPIK